MKKNLLLLFIATFALTLHAHQIIDLRTGQIVDNIQPLPPEKTVEKCENGLIVTYKFTHATVEYDSVYPNTVFLRIPGIGNIETSGYPCVPSIIDNYVFYLNTDINLSIISTKHIELDYKIAPTRTPQSYHFNGPYDQQNVLPIRYYNGFWPENECIQLPIGRFRDSQTTDIEINPIRYNILTGKVRILTEFKYKITSIEPDNILENFCQSDYSINPNYTYKPSQNLNARARVNPISIGAWNANAGYVIVSVPEFKNALKDFVTWKKTLGYNIKEFYDEDWDSTKIQNVIKKLYWQDDSCKKIDRYFNLSYVLFVGNDSLVPAGKIRYPWPVPYSISDKFYLTDMPYSCMDGPTDQTPDIYRGRWPVSFESEVEAIVKKTIRYEQAPPENIDFYRTGTHFAFFEDGGYSKHDGEEDGRFVKSSEDVRDYLANNYNYNIERIYTRDTSKRDSNGIYHRPNRWSMKYSEGGELPEELLSTTFNWDGTNPDLNKAINLGTSYILVSGHGDVNTWAWGTNRWYAYYDVQWLKNDNQLPVIFSNACLGGKFNDYRCLMRQFLSNPRGGAIGAFASTHVVWYTQYALLNQ